MLRRGLMISAMAGMLVFGAAAQVYVNVAPPRAVVESRPPAPGPGYVWTPGYHRWDGHAHVWVGGAWVRPPHPHQHWVAAHWTHRHEGSVLVEGHWR